VLQKMLVREVMNAQLFLTGEPVTGGQHRKTWFGEQQRRLQAGEVDRHPDIPNIGAAVVQHGDLVGPVGPQHLDADIGMGGAQRAHRFRYRQARHEAHRECDGPRRGPSRPAPRSPRIGEQQCGIGQQLMARRGQLRARAIAGE
jgi:hypothetical protein